MAAANSTSPSETAQVAAARVCRWLLGGACGDVDETSDTADRDAQLILALTRPAIASRHASGPVPATAMLDGPDPWGKANYLSLVAIAAEQGGALEEWHRSVKAAAARAVHRYRQTDPVAAIGVWAHLVPVELACGPTVQRSPDVADWVLRQQHGDGLAYPVAGGGACPDYNFLSVVLTLEREHLIARDRAEHAIDRLLDALERELQEPLVAESFRRGPLPLHRRMALPRSARAWTSPRTMEDLGLAIPDWFSTLMRVVTVLAAIGWQFHLPRDPGMAMHHLGCWLPADRAAVIQTTP